MKGCARPKHGPGGGFTLVELMTVVAIIGILAAVAIPSFIRYIRRAKTTEAMMNVRKMYDASIGYFVADRATLSGGMVSKQFPATQATTPALGTCCVGLGGKCAPNPTLWGTTTWSALNFAVDDPFYFHYFYLSAGTDRTSNFHARAFGDLDCDNVYSTYERIGSVDSQLNITGSAGFFLGNDLE